MNAARRAEIRWRMVTVSPKDRDSDIFLTGWQMWIVWARCWGCWWLSASRVPRLPLQALGRASVKLAPIVQIDMARSGRHNAKEGNQHAKDPLQQQVTDTDCEEP
jgi:hypothetical protein